MAPPIVIQPPLKTIKKLLAEAPLKTKPNLIPLCTTFEAADLLTPSIAYLKVSTHLKSDLAFLFESAAASESVGRFSFVGAAPRKVIKTGPGHGPEVDPLTVLELELSKYREARIDGQGLPPLTGGAIGFVGYDCVRYFEPKTQRPMRDVLQVPESFFMLFDTIVSFDHFFQKVKVITYLHVPHVSDKVAFEKALEKDYISACDTILDLLSVLQNNALSMPQQGIIRFNQRYASNIGEDGYKAHVRELKDNIRLGNIIQTVPSQRFSRPTTLHPYNIYRQLRTINPSPYLFYIDCAEFQLVGASPELLVKSEKGRIITHPIAGTIRRGKSPEEDDELAKQLLESPKERAEHVMLCDLARNDVNRVCDPATTRVDRLMRVEKFSHVQHLVSQVSGVLRQGRTRFHAFRSIFPAGTVSGAPKVRAMELIAELEKEKRGVYAGAVGYFGYDSVDNKGKVAEGAMDTCIALRTMLIKGGIAFLQAGGGIVFDSEEQAEYDETLHKLEANMRCIAIAEERFAGMQTENGGGRTSVELGTVNGGEGLAVR